MNLLLEFCKHGLAVKSTLKLIQKIIDQISLLLYISSMLQQIMNQQGFVAGGSHFRDKKNTVSGIWVRLYLIGVMAVDRVTHLMRQRKHMIQAAVVIQQHIRVCSVRAPGIRTAPLS